MSSLRLDTGKGLAVLDLPRTVLLEADSLDGDEARSVLGRPVHVQRVHAALVGRVEVGSLAGTSNNVRASFIGDEVHLALDLTLRELDGILNKLPLGAEVHAYLKS